MHPRSVAPGARAQRSAAGLDLDERFGDIAQIERVARSPRPRYALASLGIPDDEREGLWRNAVFAIQPPAPVLLDVEPVDGVVMSGAHVPHYGFHFLGSPLDPPRLASVTSSGPAIPLSSRPF